MEQLPAKIRRRGTLKNIQEQRLISRQNKMMITRVHDLPPGRNVKCTWVRFFLVITWGKQVTDRQRDIPHLNLGTFILVKETPTPLLSPFFSRLPPPSSLSHHRWYYQPTGPMVRTPQSDISSDSCRLSRMCFSKGVVSLSEITIRDRFTFGSSVLCLSTK
jgi:hypothetical protein